MARVGFCLTYLGAPQVIGVLPEFFPLSLSTEITGVLSVFFPLSSSSLGIDDDLVFVGNDLEGEADFARDLIKNQ